MQMCLSHPVEGYYMKGEPIGARGDFITSPEISQVFGEVSLPYYYTRLKSTTRLAKYPMNH